MHVFIDVAHTSLSLSVHVETRGGPASYTSRKLYMFINYFAMQAHTLFPEHTKKNFARERTHFLLSFSSPSHVHECNVVPQQGFVCTYQRQRAWFFNCLLLKNALNKEQQEGRHKKNGRGVHSEV